MMTPASTGPVVSLYVYEGSYRKLMAVTAEQYGVWLILLSKQLFNYPLGS
ncbi:MAG: hypothetical protein Q7T62_02020 [Undibacterium sp.]|nr:hypothetical protein [Undibacterium sp.]